VKIEVWKSYGIICDILSLFQVSISTQGTQIPWFLISVKPLHYQSAARWFFIYGLCYITNICFITATAAATLSISPRKVRQINDPISQILNQLHKIIFITQVWSTSISLWQHFCPLHRYFSLFPMIISRPWERDNLDPTAVFRNVETSFYMMWRKALENPVFTHCGNHVTRMDEEWWS